VVKVEKAGKTVPQGLKSALSSTTYGTTKVVPFQNWTFTTGCLAVHPDKQLTEQAIAAMINIVAVVINVAKVVLWQPPIQSDFLTRNPDSSSGSKMPFSGVAGASMRICGQRTGVLIWPSQSTASDT
jgi:hypothetical protein